MQVLVLGAKRNQDHSGEFEGASHATFRFRKSPNKGQVVASI